MAIFVFAGEAHGKANVNRRTPGSKGAPRGFVITAKQYVIALCFPAVFSAVAYFYWVAKATKYPYEFDYGEGIVLWQVAHVTKLTSAYAPIAHYPYIVFHYPPLYHAVSWATSRLTGDLLFAGRLVSLLSTLALCATLGWTVYGSVPRRVSGLATIGGAIFASTLPCGLDNMSWALLMRVDMLGLCLTFAGLALFVLGRGAATRYCAFVLFVAAVFTKQTLIAGPVACLIVAAVLNIRQATKLMLFTVSLGAFVLAVLALVTHGQVILHLFLYNQNPFSLRQAIRFTTENIQVTLSLLALACAGALSSLSDAARAFSGRALGAFRAQLTNSSYRRALFTFSIHFLFSGLVSLTAGKEGSNNNYFLEWNLSACVLAGLVVARLISGWKTIRRRSLPAYVAYLLPLLMVAQEAAPAFRFAVPSAALRQEYADSVRNTEALVHILQSSPEPVMSENMTLLYIARKQVPFEPAIITQLARTRFWDERPLIGMIQKRVFSVMIVHDVDNRVRYSPGVALAIKENYKPAERYGQLTVYRPSGTGQSESTVPKGNQP